MNQAKRRIVLAVTLAEQGGVQAFLVKFAAYLQKQGHEVTVLAGEGEWLFETCQREGMPAQKLTHMRRALHPWHDTLALLELIRLFHRIQPDAIHLNSSKMGAIGALAGRIAGIERIVYRIGGWVFLEPLSRPMRWLYTMIERVSAGWKDIIICVHPKDEEIARTLHIHPRKNIVSIPNGIDIEVFDRHLLPREEARQALAIEPGAFIFGTVANLFPAKDLPRYLEACKEVHDAHPNTRFIIIGEGMERKAIESKRRSLKLEKAVTLPGLIQNASHLLKAFDAFVLPSAKEGMSWALLEAMAAELPCIATDVGANGWLLLPNAGWIVKAQDTQALASAMQEALDDKSKAGTFASTGRARIIQDFPLEKTLANNEQALIS